MGSVLEGDVIAAIVCLVQFEVIETESEQSQKAVADRFQPIHYLLLSLFVQLLYHLLQFLHFQLRFYVAGV